jgi:hypothetical protein
LDFFVVFADTFLALFGGSKHGNVLLLGLFCLGFELLHFDKRVITGVFFLDVEGIV